MQLASAWPNYTRHTQAVAVGRGAGYGRTQVKHSAKLFGRVLQDTVRPSFLFLVQLRSFAELPGTDSVHVNQSLSVG